MNVRAEARPVAALANVPVYLVVSMAGVGLGAMLMAMATRAPAALVGVWPPMMLWAILGLSKAGRIERIAARLRVKVFAACILVAGLSAVYQTTMFGSNLESSEEIAFWYGLSRHGWIDDELIVNAPYAVLTWRTAYELAAKAGLGDGLWVGLVVNAVLVAMSASIAVRTVGILFPADRVIARRTARLLLWCPVLWLFGALLVRDSFALLLQVLVLATFVSLLQRLTAGRLVTHAAVIAVLATIMRGIRLEMLATLPILAVLAAVSWTLQGRGLRRIGLLFTASVASLLLLALSLDQIVNVVAVGQSRYLEMMTFTEGGTSGLGYRLVVSQPLPLRVVTGFIYMHVFPIPVWNGFHFSSWDYHWLKSFTAIFMILVSPLAAVGFWRAMQRAMRGEPRSAPLTFVALYWPAMVAAVALTSLETRHIGQFVPAFILLAVVPDFRQRRDRLVFCALASCWYGCVVFGHLLWALVR